MTQVVSLPTIEKALDQVNLVQLMEEGFVAYSQGNVVVPPF